LRRTTSYDVLSAKIGPTGSSVGALMKRKKEVNIRRFWVYISRMWGQNPLGGLSPNFFGRRYLRRNHMFQIWWRSVQGRRLRVKFCHSPLTSTVVLTTLSHYRVSVWYLQTARGGKLATTKWQTNASSDCQCVVV